MLSDPLVADVDVPSGSAVTASFTLLNMKPNGTDRINFAADVGEPKVLQISHTNVGKGAAARKRHLVRMESYSVVDGLEDPTKKAAIYLVADIPDVGITATQKSDLFRQFVGLLRGGSGNVTYDADPTAFFDRFLNGEA